MATRETQLVHPIVIVGAGPIGLAAAAQAQARGLEAIVLERGAGAGASVREWGHVRLFSSWAELVDPAAESLLAATGWTRPDPSTYPTGADWAELYLEPLAAALDATPQVQVRYGHNVTGVARTGRDRLVDSGREEAAFVVHVETSGRTGAGEERVTASAVIDASGTWTGPNPLGGDGLPALGERSHADRITYGIPDFTDPATRARFAGKHVAVAGTGASAQNVLVGLGSLGAEAGDAGPAQVSWLVRRAATTDAFGGGDNDQLAARGELGERARKVAESGLVTPVTGFRTLEVAPQTGQSDTDQPGSTEITGALQLRSIDGTVVTGVDEVIVVTGFRPDLGWLSEVRLDLDPVLSAPRQLAPLIDPNVHSCGTVYPHGAAELAQPESGLYLAGMKSYGRAPSFLAMTGFEQTRSIVAAIAGDHEAAARVELVLPESGVCGGSGVFDDFTGQSSEDGGGCCAPVTPELVTIGAPAGGAGGSTCG